MGFSTSVKTVFSKYIVFSGRASRSEYWYFALFCFIVSFVINGFGGMGAHNGQMPVWATVLSGLFSLIVFLPSLGVSVRRLHDIGKGGGWIFISLVPVIGWIWYLVLMVMPSQPYDNRFGSVPA